MPRTYKPQQYIPAPSRQRRIPSAAPGLGLVLSPDHPAVVDGRTLFPKSVIHPSTADRLLKSGHNQRKIGKRVTKGRWAGAWIYCLTLEERATCPSTCQHWRSCYGNNMHWSQRFIAGRSLELRLWAELEALDRQHRRDGFIVRLHILGDFYSVEYVRFWERALGAFPALRVYGYTARTLADPIGIELQRLSDSRWDRFAMRFSGRWGDRGATTFEEGEQPTGIPCPAQNGGTECCATCGLCWQTVREISFVSHGDRSDASPRATAAREKVGRPPSKMTAFAEALAEHDAEAGDPGGDLRVVAGRLGISPTYANAMLQRLRAKMGAQAV